MLVVVIRPAHFQLDLLGLPFPPPLPMVLGKQLLKRLLREPFRIVGLGKPLL